MPSFPPAAIAALVAAQILLLLLKSFALPSSDRKVMSYSLRECVRVLLLLAGVACSLCVSVISWKDYRTCHPTVRAAIGVAVTTSVTAALAETLSVVAYIVLLQNSNYVEEEYVSPLIIVVTIPLRAPLISTILVAAVQTWLRNRKTCSSHHPDAITVLVFGSYCIVTGILTGIYESATIVQNDSDHPDSLLFVMIFLVLYYLALALPLIAFGLGLWAAIDSSREVLRRGLIVILPQTLSMLYTMPQR